MALALDIVLWVFVGILTLAVLALARQVGVLNQRVAPAGALMPTTGPKVGELTEAVDADDLAGTAHRIGGPSADDTLVLFISPTCPGVQGAAAGREVAQRGGEPATVVASDGFDAARHRTFAKDVGLERYPYVLSQALGMRYGVSRLPFAVLIGADGVLRGRGLVNSREHLESLVESWRTGVATLQEYVQEIGGVGVFDPGASRESG